jgi:hypothetical protein
MNRNPMPLFFAIVLALLVSGCGSIVRIDPPAVSRRFDGLPDPAAMKSRPTRIARGTPLNLVVSKNTERLLSLMDACRNLTLKDAPQRSSLLLGLTGITPREVNARLDIGQTYVAKVAGALQHRFGKVAFADSIDEAKRANHGNPIALLDATGGDTRCSQSGGGEIGLVLDRIDTSVAFVSPEMDRLCEVNSDAPWFEAQIKGVLPWFGTSLERYREYLDWVGERLGAQLDKCVN